MQKRPAAATVMHEEIHAQDTGKKIVKERENANYKFLQLIYKKLVDNEVDSKYADEIIADIEASLKKESNIDSILSAVYQKIILKLGEPLYNISWRQTEGDIFYWTNRRWKDYNYCKNSVTFQTRKNTQRLLL